MSSMLKGAFCGLLGALVLLTGMVVYEHTGRDCGTYQKSLRQLAAQASLDQAAHRTDLLTTDDAVLMHWVLLDKTGCASLLDRAKAQTWLDTHR